MANTPRDLCRRLELFGIDDTTKTALARLLPFASRELDVILHEFYRTIRAIPQIEKKLVGVDQGRLMQKQRAHWMALLSCEWDHAYLRRVIAIGTAHVRSGGNPSIYAAGYGGIHQGVIRSAVRAFGQSDELSGILCALNKVVAMDQDLVTSYHMREYWKEVALRLVAEPSDHMPESLDEPETEAVEDENIVYL